jgi:hypothetical protein
LRVEGREDSAKLPDAVAATQLHQDLSTSSATKSAVVP